MGRKLFFLTAIVLTLLIGWGSLVSVGNSIPKSISISDKVIHATAYFALALSWLLAFKRDVNKSNSILLVLFIVFLYGIIIEVLQGSLTAHRQFEIKDIMANFTGIVLAFMFFNYFLLKKVFK